MADLSDVEEALASAVTQAIYPNGTGQPSALPGPSGFYIARGWPDANQLDADLKAGIVNISIFSISGHIRNVTRYSTEWTVKTPPAPTLTATVVGSTVTWSGSGGGGQIAGVLINGATGKSYAYPLQPTDGPAQVAAGLAALIPGATANAAALTIPGTTSITARVSAPATIWREVRRQSQGFLVTVWAPDPASRDAVTSFVDAALAAYDGLFLPLPDGSGGWLKYTGTHEDDVPSKDALWRRDLRYSVEYATMQVATAPAVLFGVSSISATLPDSNPSTTQTA